MSKLWLKTSAFVREIERCIKEDLQHTEAASLTLVAVYTLQALYIQDGQRIRDIATTIGTAVTGFTPTLDKLEELGLIRRSANVDDRRSVLIYLTKQGQQLRTVIENAIGNAEVRYGGG